MNSEMKLFYISILGYNAKIARKYIIKHKNGYFKRKEFKVYIYSNHPFGFPLIWLEKYIPTFWEKIKIFFTGEVCYFTKNCETIFIKGL